MTDSLLAEYRYYITQTSDPQAAATLVLAAQQRRESLEWLTVKDMAAATQTSTDTIYDMIDKGRLSASRFGQGRGTIRIHRGELQSLASEARSDRAAIVSRHATPRRSGGPGRPRLSAARRRDVVG